jgi:hypothetical protein
MSDERWKQVGGTPGGLGEFLFGFALVCGGGYMLFTNTKVSSGFWAPYGWGQSSFGYALVPLCIGIGFLFFDGKSPVGWVLTGAASIFIVAGILMGLNVYFQQTSLFALITMLVMLFGGIGLIARSLRAHRGS